MRTVPFLLVLFLLAVPLPAQQPAEKPSDKCTIEGQVVKTATGEPLKKAWLVLRKAEGRSEPTTAITDASGRFTIADIEPGRYRLWAARNGYVRQEYGQSHPNRPGTTVTLTSGQHLRDVVFRLIPAAVIAGRVYDEDGEAMPGVVVRALRYRYFQGKRQLVPARQDSTNDLGEFRLYGLAPGQYRISATFSPARAGLFGLGGLISLVRGGRSRADEGYVPTFYPGTNDAEDAGPVAVKSGDELRGIDFMLLPSRTVRISGRVFNAVTGRPGRDVGLWLLPRTSTFATFSFNNRARVDEQGRFELRGVAPGSYVLTANWFDADERYTSRVPLDVGGADVEGVEVVIERGVNLPGQLSVDGQQPAAVVSSASPASDSESGTGENSLADLRVYLEPRQSLPFRFGGGTARLQDDGTFTLENVGRGDYWVRIRRLPPDSYLKAARLGGDDLLEEGLTISGGRLPGRLDLLVSSAGARVEGVVLDPEQQPFSGARVVLVPDQRRRHRNELFKTTTTDQNGRFTLRGIPPGEYKLFAWEEVEAGAYQDSDFLRPYEDRGHTVRIDEGARLNLQLELIPAGPAPR